ncbi:hypothetical protein [Streptomyces sp. NPDC001914]|uniref:hypothetical protein n=1 Tax=Streptomyces sp. NPDC001914 TaxID=3364623 RepID=UPI0036C5902E
MITESAPLSNGTDGGTTVHRLWSATGTGTDTGTCKGRPEWADLTCSNATAETSSAGTATIEAEDS